MTQTVSTVYKLNTPSQPSFMFFSPLLSTLQTCSQLSHSHTTMTLTQQQFGCGLVQAPFVTSSGLLTNAWNVISSSYEIIEGNGLAWKVYEEPDSMVVAFEIKPGFDLKPDLVSSSHLKEDNFPHFEFLCNKKIPVFSVNRSSVSLFCKNLERLEELKSRINSSASPRLIVTGLGLGGPIASLFTLSLLDSIGSGKKRPLCITFGSLLIGDKKLQEAISRSSTWSSCFIHVVSYNDPLPKKLKPDTSAYMPFGTFLFCSDISCTCFENPDSVLRLLVYSINYTNQGFQPIEYGNIAEDLYCKVICKDFIPQVQDLTNSTSLRASICLQLCAALGLTRDIQQQQQQNSGLNTLIEKLETLEKIFIHRKIKYDPSKKLNSMKIDMANLEWYKKDSKDRHIGYYDSYKRRVLTCDDDVINFQKNLTNYWKDMVAEAEMKPQREGAAFRVRWLYGGTNYRRMVEPLDIAEYYRDGRKDYVNQGRSEHYKVLERWLEEDKKNKPVSEGSNKRNVELLLTIDSCFWAYVEEALLLCKQLQSVQSSETEREEATRKLLVFEEYVYGLLKKYEVSPEIFLKKSSYMEWWNQYRENSGKPELASFMNNPDNYHQYTVGNYDFP